MNGIKNIVEKQNKLLKILNNSFVAHAVPRVERGIRTRAVRAISGSSIWVL